MTLESRRLGLFKKIEFVYRVQISTVSLCFRGVFIFSSVCSMYKMCSALMILAKLSSFGYAAPDYVSTGTFYQFSYTKLLSLWIFKSNRRSNHIWFSMFVRFSEWDACRFSRNNGILINNIWEKIELSHKLQSEDGNIWRKRDFLFLFFFYWKDKLLL